METQVNKRPLPLVPIAGITMALFIAAGTATTASREPTLVGNPSAIFVSDDLPVASAEPVASRTRVRTKCAECGVISSMREIEARNEDTDPGVA